MTGILDYGIGNTGSILNMLRRLSLPARLIQDPREFEGVRRILLPGVGSFDAGMTNLQNRGFVEPLHTLVLTQKIPVLGICLGMQLMAGSSEEGTLKGLGWIAGDVIRLRSVRTEAQNSIKIPHMGWNEVTPAGESILFRDLVELPRYYFVHSYHLKCHNPGDVSGTVEYGGRVTAAVSYGNIHGVQFHPEKSHRFGMHLLQNFCTLEAKC